jgi:type III restriction enzyme
VAVLKQKFGPESLSKLNGLLSEWSAKKAAFELEYESAKSKSQSSQQQLQEIQKIEERISEINKSIAERKSKVKELGDPEVEFAAQRQNWKEAHSRKITLLNEQAVQFTLLSKNLIKAEITKNIDLQSFKNLIKQLLEGTRIREDKIDAIVDKIRQSGDPLSEYVRISDEFRLLSELKTSENKEDKIPETSLLSTCGFTEDHKRKLCGKITGDDWLKIAANELDFTPQFFYSTNNTLGDVIPFSDASAGQQATSLLTVLLNQPGIPLLIAQPEDDIDNRAIEQIINNIWDAKKKRQLLFTSHNANLVVNGDSELVVCCDYSDSTNQTRGIIKAEGAIDTKQVRNEITSVMEGGEKAFKLRKDKYGF